MAVTRGTSLLACCTLTCDGDATWTQMRSAVGRGTRVSMGGLCPRLMFTPVLARGTPYVAYVHVKIRVAFRAEGEFPYTVTYTPPPSPLAKMAQQIQTGVVVVCPKSAVETAALILSALEMTGSFGDLRVLETDRETKRRVLFRCQLKLPEGSFGSSSPLPRDMHPAVRALVAREVDKVMLTVDGGVPVKLTGASSVQVGVSYGSLFPRDADASRIVAELEVVWTDTKVSEPELRGVPYTVRYRGNEGRGFVAVDATRDQATAHTAKALVLTCMDFRFVDDIASLMSRLGYHNNYDLFTLAGASLGFAGSDTSALTGVGVSNNPLFKDIDGKWDRTFLDHIDLAIQLHKISEVIVVDHLECGCYKAYYGTKVDDDAAAVARHFTNMEAFCMYISNKLGVATKGFLTRVDGTLEPGMGEAPAFIAFSPTRGE
jgi:hypothetical protein